LKQTVDLETIKQQLLEKREQLLEGVARARQSGTDETDAAAPDIADRATSAFQRDFSFHLSETEGQMLRLIDEALARIQNDRFGSCIKCGQSIEPPRLQAIPWARHCIACQELQDRGEI
jgi:DnaK suppressor protein